MKPKNKTVPAVKPANRCPIKSAGALPVDLHGAGRPLPVFNPSGPIPFTVPETANESAAALAVILSALAESLENNREQMRFAADPEIYETLERERADLLSAFAWAEKTAGKKGGNK